MTLSKARAVVMMEHEGWENRTHMRTQLRTREDPVLATIVSLVM